MTMVSPFHADELAAQRLAGAPATGAGIRDHMPEQHRTFFAGLRYVFVGTADADGWPVATTLAGDPGFVSAPDPVTLRIAASFDPGDPAAPGLAPGREIGLLGLDLATRRRNRANGHVVAHDATGWTLAVRQSFGNCAKYIQRRTIETASHLDGRIETLDSLDLDAQRLISGADTFFVASRSRPDIGAAGGLDISHRGGRPGFIAVASDTLNIPDYVGNRYFNTLGNLLGEPRAGLLFLDFASGDLLQLQGMAGIDWDSGGAGPVKGAQRCWRFTIVRGWRRRAALPWRGHLVDYSPATLETGIWPSKLQEPLTGSDRGRTERSRRTRRPAAE